MNIENLTAVASGAVFCECGGMMRPGNAVYLMSDPPKQEINCPFCGNKKTVLAPYNVNIEFKIAQ